MLLLLKLQLQLLTLFSCPDGTAAAADADAVLLRPVSSCFSFLRQYVRREPAVSSTASSK